MQKQTNDTQSNILHTQLQQEESPHKETYSEVIKNEPIDGTPFNIVGNIEQGFCVTLGRYKVTESVQWDDRNEQTLQELGTKLLEDHKWNIILNCIAIFVENFNYGKPKEAGN